MVAAASDAAFGTHVREVYDTFANRNRNVAGALTTNVQDMNYQNYLTTSGTTILNAVPGTLTFNASNLTSSR